MISYIETPIASPMHIFCEVIADQIVQYASLVVMRDVLNVMPSTYIVYIFLTLRPESEHFD